MEFSKIIAQELGIRTHQINEAIQLLDAGNTIPFIARYRKEATGELDENVLRSIVERLEYLRNLEHRKSEVLRLIEEQGKLTDELTAQITKATILQEVEDIYRPYKQKRRTRATVAREKGLEPLALWVIEQYPKAQPLEEAQKYINEELGVETSEEAIDGASDIIAEMISDDATMRKRVREATFRLGDMVASAKKAEERSAYEMYYDYREPVKKLPPHRILALNRGEKEELLSVKVEVPAERILLLIEQVFVKQGPAAEIVRSAAEDSYKRLIAPSIEREIRSSLSEKAEEQAIKVFAGNLRQLLLQPPVRGKVVLGLDPGFRTGCKYAVVDDTGKLFHVGVIYPHPPQNKREEAKDILRKTMEKYQVDVIAIGNGTASRETEEVTAELLRESGMAAEYIIVSEAGASVYSASKLAGEEFPDFDLSLRSAVSIARRLQDPLAELVKIEPKAVGVGQYQHDVQPKRLEESLHGVVESAVNAVGVDLNTASPSLLQYIAGLKPTIAKNIVAYRENHGKFQKRDQLKKVPRLGEQTYVQCAGFIRIPEGTNPLENTPVHPESYELARNILHKAGFTIEDLKERPNEVRLGIAQLSPEECAQEFSAGVPTVKDILAALQRPGRDPREDLPKPKLRQDVTHLEDLQTGMIMEGTVRNIVDFGAFIDIGVKHDGLVHISQISEKFIKHPMEVLSVGDIVKVRVLGIDSGRERVSLSMREIPKDALVTI
ncbi:transcriptional accessory protein [Desulfitobacterium dichloroeliminans LMG P-21439]|uniref:Transcriptional accessory protein n=1 Tax=Desulfitobacterium dichloroeliminans (strain LMG P-21439 / DCA1) TaxID=871963 RepID=L0F7Q7_DESDL|nr:Tex family protein [Desulfitobacterium dichloroeliminans]AGA68686.1 transcriptional accessory protein [Desulfitobacterium dichloroeliminans LMG P-21439]